MCWGDSVNTHVNVPGIFSNNAPTIETVAERIGRCLKRASDGAELAHLEGMIVMAYAELLALGVTPEDIQRRLDRVFNKHVFPEIV